MWVDIWGSDTSPVFLMTNDELLEFIQVNKDMIYFIAKGAVYEQIQSLLNEWTTNLTEEQITVVNNILTEVLNRILTINNT